MPYLFALQRSDVQTRFSRMKVISSLAEIFDRPHVIYHNRFFWVYKFETGNDLVEPILYGHWSGSKESWAGDGLLNEHDYISVQIGASTEEELEECLAVLSKDGNFKMFLLDVNAPLAIQIGKKYGYFIMNRWFHSAQNLLEFYRACRDFDKSIPTHLFLKGLAERLGESW